MAGWNSWYGMGGDGSGGGGNTSGGDSWWSNIDWGKILQGAAGAALGYYGSRQEEQAREGAGEYGGNQSTSPWGPSVPYREFGMERALQLLGLGGSGGGGARRGGGGGGGGWRGPSDETNRLLDSLGARATGGSPLYGAGESYVQGTLGGQDQNPYRSDLYGRLGGLQDPDLERFKEMLFSGQMPGSGDALGSFASSIRSSGGGGGGGGGAEIPLPVGAADYIKQILGGQYLEGNPFLDETIGAATRGLKEDFYERELPGVLASFGGSGRFGGGIASQFAAQESRGLANAMGDVNARMRASDYEARMGDLMDALGLGTSLDQTAMTTNASRANAASAAGASRYGADLGLASDMERLASQERLARMGALSGAIGQGVDLTQFGLSGQMGLADLFGQDQRFALAAIPELSGLDIRDLTSALGARLPYDQMGFQASESAANRRQSNSRYAAQRPWDEARMYLDLINSASAGGGSTTSGGFQNAWAPYMGSAWQQALAGGLGGYYGDWGSVFGGASNNAPRGSTQRSSY